MSHLLPHIVLLLIGVVVFYTVMDIALTMQDTMMPWWLKYVMAIVIFAILGCLEVFFMW